MDAAIRKTQYTVEEYLYLEEKATYRSEYFEGEIFAMAGGSSNHSQIAGNLIYTLNAALRDKDCYVYTSDLKLHIEKANAFVYPDAMVVCNKKEYHKERKDIIKNPTVIFEVLSPSTAAFDRGGKFMRYATLPSLKEYIVIESTFARIEVFTKQEEGKWIFKPYNETKDIAQITSLNIDLPLEEIYRKIQF